jgi:hypothetical protein
MKELMNLHLTVGTRALETCMEEWPIVVPAKSKA